MNLSDPNARSPLIRYGAVVLALLLATLLRLLLEPHLGVRGPTLTYFAVVMFAAWFAGLWPGLLSLVAGALLASHLFIPPEGSLAVAGVANWANLGLYLITGLIIVGLGHSLQSSRMQTAESEQRLRRLLDSSSVGFCLADKKKRIQYMNKALRSMLGYQALSPERMGEVTCVDEQMITQLERTGLCVPFEREIQANDGHRFPALISGSVLDHNGKEATIAVSVTDLTPLREAQAALRKSEQHYREVVETASCTIMRLDHEGRIIFANGYTEQLLGYSGEELTGRSISSLRTASPKEAGEQDWSVLLEEIVDDPSKYHYHETENLRKDGRPVWLAWNARLIDGADPQTPEFLAVGLDITERKRAQIDLAKSEERLRMAAAAANFGLFDIDLMSGEEFWSPELKQIFGIESDAPVERDEHNVPLCVHPEDREHVRKLLETAGSGAGSGEVEDEHRIVWSDGTVRWVLMKGKTFFAGDGANRHPVRLSGTVLDITARKLAEQALKESEARLQWRAKELADADHRKDLFMATLAHELRNPLAPISNALQLIKRGGSPQVLEQALAIAERQLNHMVRLVNDLLDAARIKQGRIRLHREPVTLNVLIDSALETSRPHIEAAKHQLTVDIPDETIYLEADVVRASQAIANILINAAKYTPPGGRIRVTARVDQNDVSVAIQDNGVGFSPQVLPRMFEMFAHTGEEAQSQGLGIGLPLAKLVVELHGGSIEGISAGPGQGSTFVLRFPLKATAPAGYGPDQSNVRQETSKPRKVLIVDDNADSADSSAMLLKGAGHQVRVAYDGPSAIQAALDFLPDVVVLDIGMPGMDGYEVARRLRQEPSLKQVSLIALTGWGEQSDRQHSWEAGFNYHLVKPVDLVTLEALFQDHAALAPVD